ncbi:hypothetical protein LP419_02540 [Massilia sp. H-1]|nr:hypothetical protein LP419_02540 [Massilia sp. H-1]
MLRRLDQPAPAPARHGRAGGARDRRGHRGQRGGHRARRGRGLLRFGHHVRVPAAGQPLPGTDRPPQGRARARAAAKRAA